MRDLFAQYWWLMFPLAWVLLGSWRQWLRHRTFLQELEIRRVYTAAGKTAPAGLSKGA
jgi:hypothetical protein